MQTRHAIHPEHAVTMTSDALRDHFLINNLFIRGEIKLVYSHNDRLIVGGICPDRLLVLEVDNNIVLLYKEVMRRSIFLIGVVVQVFLGSYLIFVLYPSKEEISTKNIFSEQGGAPISADATKTNEHTSFSHVLGAEKETFVSGKNTSVHSLCEEEIHQKNSNCNQDALPNIDFNNDSMVDCFDYSLFKGVYGKNNTYNAKMDLDCNGTIDFLDFSIFAQQFDVKKAL